MTEVHPWAKGSGPSAGCQTKLGTCWVSHESSHLRFSFKGIIWAVRKHLDKAYGKQVGFCFPLCRPFLRGSLDAGGFSTTGPESTWDGKNTQWKNRKRRVNLEKNEIQLAKSYTRRRWLPSWAPSTTCHGHIWENHGRLMLGNTQGIHLSISNLLNL